MAEVDTVSLGELRRAVEAMRADLGTARSELGALTAIPVQLDSMAALWNAQLAAARQEHQADMASVRESLANMRAQVERDLAGKASTGSVQGLREDVEDLATWKTWAIRLVLGVVLLAIVGLVVGQPPGT